MTLTGLLRFGVAFALLNTLLTFENQWPGLGVRFQPRLSFELCLLVLALLAWAHWRGRTAPTARPLRLNGLASGFVLLVLARYLDVTASAVFGRPINLYWDARHALDVLSLATQGMTGLQLTMFGAGLLALAIVVVALWRVARWGLASLAGGFASPTPRLGSWTLGALAGLGAALTVCFLGADAVGRDTRWFFATPVLPTLARQAVFLQAALNPTKGDGGLAPSPLFADHNLDALHGADVMLIFAESYGVTVFDNPQLAAALLPARQRLEAAARASGRGVVSARLHSPTFGGGSWLAHATLLSGIDTARPEHYDLLLASHRPSLVSHFAAHGYRTVGWMPGLQRPWPEGSFYGFDRLAGADGIGYAGLDFGYWRIPDQAALALLNQQELSPAARSGAPAPRFVVFPTLGTHAPFRPLAPYLDDWSRVVRADAYSMQQREASLSLPVSWSDAVPAYLQSVRYQFDWLSGYLEREAPRSLVLIVVGDHQPLAAVSGPHASHDVPVQVIASDTALLQRLVERGFAAGTVPPPQTLTGMEGFTRLLLEVFGAP